MPEIIDDIARHFLTRPLPSAPTLPATVKAKSAAHAHGRWLAGFDVSTVLWEFEVLRESILATALNHGVDVSVSDTTHLSRGIISFVSESVTEYSRLRDEEFMRLATEHVGFLSHELRTPIQVAQLATHRMKEAKHLEPTALKTLERSLHSLRQLIDDTLVQAKLNTEPHPNFAKTELRQVIQEVYEESLLDAEHKGIEIIPQVAPMQLTADARLVRSALSNLVRNAVKFSHEHGTISISANTVGDMARISVRDSCGGLPPGQAAELFESFVQKGKDRSGFGLGIKIAAQAARAHQGHLAVENHPGQGCTFTLSLPLRQHTKSESMGSSQNAKGPSNLEDLRGQIS